MITDSFTVDNIRPCLEGAVPATMATCSASGVPNVAYLSQVEYVDSDHIALSFQFFNKTRQNMLENPIGKLLLIDPATGAMYRLHLRYLRTETEGALFERMKAKLAGIASHTGMSDVFKLRGSDIHRVESIECVPGNVLPTPAPARSVLAALHHAVLRMQRCGDLDALFETVLSVLREKFAIEQAMILLLDSHPLTPPAPPAQKLYAVASSGYPESGVGAEIPLGEGVIGVCAQMRTPIRIGHMTTEYAYGRAVRAATIEAGFDDLLETEIPLPGLAESRSQLAVPITAFSELFGVLYVESSQDLRFSYDDEDALVAIAAQIGLSMLHFQCALDQEPALTTELPQPTPTANDKLIGKPISAPATVRYYADNHSIFIDGDYLIKGVAGAIFWTLLQDHINAGRRVFTNRELRLDPRVQLPELSDNLEARLILLKRRLEERNACVRIQKCGRGQFHLEIDRPLSLTANSA